MAPKTTTNPAVIIPPQNVEAEAAVLGSILLDGKALLEEVADWINPTDFYREVNGQIFQAMLDLFQAGEPIDTLTVANKLEEAKQLQVIGGAAYLTELVGAVPSTANFLGHVEIVEKKATLRRLIDASQHISRLAFAEADPAEEIVDQAEETLFKVNREVNKDSFIVLEKQLEDTFERYDLAHQNKGQLHGVPTGLRDVDNVLSGLQQSNLIILAARPSMGKTTLALNIARNAALRSRKKVGIFSLEMSNDQLVDRLVALEAGVDAWRLRTGNLQDQDFSKLGDAFESLSKAGLYLDDMTSLTTTQMKARARRLQQRFGLDLLIVDYLQLMQGDARSRSSDNRVQEVSEISRSLKALARELNIPILALSQLSRAVETRDRKMPQLADLRESGSIEQDADVVMFIYREAYYDKENVEEKNKADILIKKHRNGPTRDLTLYFDASKQRFTDLAKADTPPPAAPEGA